MENRNCKNYMTDGGDTLVIGGKLTVLEGATVEGLDDGGSGSSSYVLPTASADTLGGVRIGDGLTIDATGVLSTEGSEMYTATTSSYGTVKMAAKQAPLSSEAELADAIRGFNALLTALKNAGIMAES